MNHPEGLIHFCCGLLPIPARAVCCKCIRNITEGIRLFAVFWLACYLINYSFLCSLDTWIILKTLKPFVDNICMVIMLKSSRYQIINTCCFTWLQAGYISC